jgi:ABC-type nitrate/sulfonate/bicarbonate transport system substrate-binding protein
MRSYGWRSAVSALAIAATVTAATAGPAPAQEMEATLALPATTFAFVPVYVAEDLGSWTKRGLKLKTTIIVGIGSMNAVLSRSVEFTLSSTPTLLRAHVRGQKVLAIASGGDRTSVEIVLRKDLADAAGITDRMPLGQRADSLKGKKLALQGLNAIPHGVLRYFVKKGTIDSERDIQLVQMQPEASLAALGSKQIDGLAEVLPYSTMSVHRGYGVVIASVPRGDFPELEPYASNAVTALPSTCEQKPELCQRMVDGFAEAVAFIHAKPQEAAAILKKRIPNMDNATFNDAFKLTLAGIPKSLKHEEAGLRNAQELAFVGGMMKPEEKMSSFEAIYTNKFIK